MPRYFFDFNKAAREDPEAAARNTALFLAVRHDDWKEAGVISFRPDTEILEYALRQRHVDWVDRLLDAGARPTAEMLNAAVVQGNKAVTRLLLRAQVKPSRRTLRFARRHPDPVWQDMLVNGNFYSRSFKSLHQAVLRGERKQAESLISTSNSVPDQRTLGLAVRRLDSTWVKMLLDAGATATPEILYEAVTMKKWAVVDVLTAAGVVPDEKTLTYAVSNLGTGWVKRLIDAGARSTPEMYEAALHRHRFGTLEVLPQGGAVPDEKLMMNSMTLTSGVTEALIRTGAKLTPAMLHRVVERNDVDVARLLIARGVVPEQKTLDYARDKLDSAWLEVLSPAVSPKASKDIILRRSNNPRRNSNL